MAKKTRRALQREDKHDPRGILLGGGPNVYVDEYVPAPRGKPNFHIQPKTTNQELMMQAIESQEVIIAEAPAGCGKTFISGSMAAKFLAEGQVDRIILTRANVVVGESRGMLPGTIDEKMEPLLVPILSVLKGRMGDGLYAYNRAKKKIDIQALEYVRGQSWADSFIIIDEAQNLSVDDVIAIYTRFESGKILFIGDPFQTDVEGKNGLTWLSEFSDRHGLNVGHIKFTIDDVVRSGVVKRFLKALYAERNK